MSDDNKKDIQNIIKQLENKKCDIEELIKAKEWPIEEIYKKIFNEIISELNSLYNLIITDKNQKNFFSSYDKSFLYKTINLYESLKKDELSIEIIETSITKENINTIMKIYIVVNKKNILAENIFEFDEYIIQLLSNILQNYSELLMDNMLYYKENSLNNFLIILPFHRKGREFIYDLEKYILMFIKDNKKYDFFIQSMNHTLDCIFGQLNNKNFSSVIEEIQIILYIYKSRIIVIQESMIKLLIKLFKINEDELNYFHEILTNFLKYCFNRIVFTYSSNIDPGIANNIDKNTAKKSFQYNIDFMNFLLKLYEQLIANKLKDSYINILMELYLSLDNIGNGAMRYRWLIKHTKYPEIVLESFIKLKDLNLLSLYFSKIIFLSVDNKKEYYKPSYDINFFFSRLEEIFDINNEEIGIKFFNIIYSQIVNIININNDALNQIFNKCDIFNKCLVIFNKDIFPITTKLLLLDFLERILILNNEKFKFNFSYQISNHQYELQENFDLNDINTFGIKYKLYLLYFRSDISLQIFNDNIDIIINNINYFGENKKINEMFIFISLLLDIFLLKEILKITHYLNQEIIDKINTTLYSIPSILSNKEIVITEVLYEKYIYKLLELIISHIHLYNDEIFELKKNKKIFEVKTIIDDYSIIKIFQNIFEQITNIPLKNKIISNIIFFDFSKNKINHDNNDNKKVILQSPFLFLIILKALYNNHDYQYLSKLYDDLFELINFSLINAKIILDVDIITFTISLIIDIYVNKEIDNDNCFKEFYDKALKILKILVNFLTQSSLINYLYKLYYIFYDCITDFENKNKADKYKHIILILFNILKDGLSFFYKRRKQNYQYLSLSKQVFTNPLIYNLFYINNLNIEEPIIHFNVDIRVNSSKNIDNFYIINFVNESSNQNLFVSLENKNILIIGEKDINSKKIDILATYENINNILKDGQFHNISIIIDTQNKSLRFMIDYKRINYNNKIIHYKNFNFDNFSLYMGYDYDIAYNYMKKPSKEIISIIDISNIILVNFKNDTDNFFINREKESIKNQYDLDFITDYFCKLKKDKQIKLILVEICLNLNYIKILNAKNIEKCDNALDKYLSKNDKRIHKYISYIEILNPLNDKCCSKLYMCTLNNNIEKYFSLNHILSLQNLNKIFIQNIFSEEKNIHISASNFFFYRLFIRILI